MKKKYNVTGMMCASCQANVNHAVCKIDGVTNVNVSLLANNMVVEFDESKVNDEIIISAVASTIIPPLMKSQVYMIFALLTRSPSTPPTGVNNSRETPHRARYRPCRKALLSLISRI